jgi:hypothetical protein
MANASETHPPFSRSTVKGTAFRGYRRYLDKRLAQDDREAILAPLPPEIVALFSGNTLLANSMYPIELQHRFLESFAGVFGNDSEGHLRKLGAEVAETDLSGVYRVFIWAASVPQTMSILTKVWNSYFSSGVARWQAEGKHNGVTRITDRHQHPLHYPVVAGYIEVAVRLAGGKNARVTYGPETDHTVPFYIVWTP